jgi:hypothetical protein
MEYISELPSKERADLVAATKRHLEESAKTSLLWGVIRRSTIETIWKVVQTVGLALILAKLGLSAL